MVKTQRGSLAGILQRLSGKSLVVTMQETKNRVRDRKTFYSARTFLPCLNLLQLAGQILDC